MDYALKWIHTHFQDLTKENIAGILFGLVGAYVLYVLIYGIFFSPTRHIPGPLLTRFSSLPYIVLRLSGKLAFEIFDQHKKYGTLPHMILLNQK